MALVTVETAPIRQTGQANGRGDDDEEADREAVPGQESVDDASEATPRPAREAIARRVDRAPD